MLTSVNDNALYYDQGWNDCVNGTQMKYPCSRDYRDGYLDCNSSPKEIQTVMGE